MERDEKLRELTSRYLPGWVCSSARVNRGINGPFYISRARGSKVYDLDGREYIDLCTSFGAALLGHAHPRVVDAINEALDMGIMCAYENESHARLAQRIADTIPCIDMLLSR